MRNSSICIDANMVVRLLVGPGGELIEQLWAEWNRDGRGVHAPFLLRYEVTNALYRYQRAGTLVNSVQAALPWVQLTPA